MPIYMNLPSTAVAAFNLGKHPKVPTGTSDGVPSAVGGSSSSIGTRCDEFCGTNPPFPGPLPGGGPSHLDRTSLGLLNLLRASSQT